MKKNHKYIKSPTKKQIVMRWIIIGLCLLLVVGGILYAVSQRGIHTDEQPTIPEIATEPIATAEPTEVTETETTAQEVTEETEPTVPEETEPVMLADMAEYYAQNPEIAGWIWINDTKLNYPVMYTPDDPEKYLHLSFKETYSAGGIPFLDSDCSLNPESDNLIIYGHNMSNGTQFKTIMSYTDKSFWESHPVFYYSTLYETRTYEILACFYDRVYYKYEDVFKFYQFIDAENEADFEEALTYYKEKSLYDTGITAEYGDNLITLVTCSYHTDYGRFVVVGRMVTEDSE